MSVGKLERHERAENSIRHLWRRLGKRKLEQASFRHAWRARRLLLDHRTLLFPEQADSGFEELVDGCMDYLINSSGSFNQIVKVQGRRLRVNLQEMDRHLMIYVLKSSDHIAKDLLRKNHRLSLHMIRMGQSFAQMAL